MSVHKRDATTQSNALYAVGRLYQAQLLSTSSDTDHANPALSQTRGTGLEDKISNMTKALVDSKFQTTLRHGLGYHRMDPHFLNNACVSLLAMLPPALPAQPPLSLASSATGHNEPAFILRAALAREGIIDEMLACLKCHACKFADEKCSEEEREIGGPGRPSSGGRVESVVARETGERRTIGEETEGSRSATCGGRAGEALRVDEDLVRLLTETLARCLEGQGLASQQEKRHSGETLAVAWQWLGALQVFIHLLLMCLCALLHSCATCSRSVLWRPAVPNRGILSFRVFLVFELESGERAEANPTVCLQCQRVTKDDVCALQVHFSHEFERMPSEERLFRTYS